MGGLYASSVDLLGDLDGDGCSEIVVGSPREQEGVGRVHVYSGKTGEELWAVDGEPDFGRGVASAGDLDLDGVPDFVVSTNGVYFEPRGKIVAVSGKDGSFLYEVQGDGTDGYFGDSMTSVGDVDSDGVPDLVIRTRRARFALLSGRDGSQLRSYDLPDGDVHDFFVFGFATALGDVDGDAVPDFGLSSNAHNRARRIEIRSGRTGAVLRVFTCGVGEDGETTMALELAAVGDVDGDGRADYGITRSWRTGSLWKGETRVFFSRLGRFGYEVREPNTDKAFQSIACLGDLTGDGKPEWVGLTTSAFYTSMGVVSGRGGQLLWFRSGGHDPNLQWIAIRADDVNGDGTPDFLVHLYSNYVRGCWGLRVHSGRDGELILQKNRASEFGQGGGWK